MQMPNTNRLEEPNANTRLRRPIELPPVIDNGSYKIKAGFAGDDRPFASFPAVVGYSKFSMQGHPKDPVDITHVGYSAQSFGRVMLNLSYPMTRGTFYKADEMTELWRHIFTSELNENPCERPVLLTDAALDNRTAKETMTQIWFETFEVPALYYSRSSVLSLYSTGRTTGIVLDSGHDITRAVPIYQGHIIHHAVTCLDFGGRDLTDFLIRRIPHLSLAELKDHEYASSLKEQHCYAALDFNAEVPRHNCPKELGKDNTRCPEGLFQPSLLELTETSGVHEIIHQSILKCHETIQQELFSNIVLAGGNTRFPGLVARMQREVTALAPTNTLVNVTCAANEAAWLGGALLATSSEFSDKCISREEYDEYGPTIIHTKCFS